LELFFFLFLLESQTIRIALKELYLKDVISYISGRYDKKLAFRAGKLKFKKKAKRYRSFYEVSAYDITGTLKFGCGSSNISKIVQK